MIIKFGIVLRGRILAIKKKGRLLSAHRPVQRPRKQVYVCNYGDSIRFDIYIYIYMRMRSLFICKFKLFDRTFMMTATSYLHALARITLDMLLKV